MKPALYTAYHHRAPMFSSAAIRPIHVGRAKANFALEGMIGDDTGDNISADNRKYCELTALYWAWKNDTTSTHLGLMHYRRLLDFAGDYPDHEAENFIGSLRIEDYITRTENWLMAQGDVDLVIPRLHTMPITVRRNYETSHEAQDLRIAERVLAEGFPDLLPYFQRVLDGRALRLGNMFLARADIFRSYCAFIFPILARIDAERQVNPYANSYQGRYLGFISERLFTAYVEKLLAESPQLKVIERNIINLSKATLYPYIKGDWLNGPENVNIAFSADNSYLPHAAAMIMSAIAHFSPERTYNLFFLHAGVKPDRLEVFASMFRGHFNIGLHFFDVGDPFKGAYRPTARSPSSATYNRILLFELLPGLKRLLYIDCDMIVNGDLAEIFDVEMGNAQVAAVPDHIMTRTLTRLVVTRDPAVPDLYKYQKEVLGLSDLHIANYFNAGLLVLNFAAMEPLKVGRDLLEMAQKGRYFFQDQDMLNSYFKDSYLRLPARYNVFNSPARSYLDAPAKNAEDAMTAKSEPFIVHFASADFKPWDYPEVENAHLYWQSLQKTPFFAPVLANIRPVKVLPRVLTRRFWFDLAKAIAARFPWMKPALYGLHRAIFQRR